MNRKKFTFDVSWAFTNQAVSSFALFLISIFIGKFLGPSPLGLYTLTITIYTIIALFVGVGIPSSIVKFTAQFRDNQKDLNNNVSISTVFSAFFGIMGSILLFLFSNELSLIFKMSELSYLIKIISFSIPFLVLNNTVLGFLNGLLEMKLFALTSIIRTVLLLSFILLFLYLGLGVIGAIIAIPISEIGTFLLLINISKKFFKFSLENFGILSKEIVKFSIPLVFGSALWMLISNIDKILVGYFLGENSLGLYAVAITLSNSILMIPAAISTVTYPSISEYNHEKKIKSIENMINISIRYCFAILSLLGIVLIFFSKEIILTLYKPEFLPAIIPLSILTLSMIFVGATISVGSAWTAMGRPDLGYKVNLMILPLITLMGIILIPYLGMVGAAISSASSLTALTLISFLIYKRSFKLNIELKRLLISFFITGAIILILLIGQEFLNVIFLGVFIIILYILMVFLILLKKEDRIFLSETIKKHLKQIIFKS